MISELLAMEQDKAQEKEQKQATGEGKHAQYTDADEKLNLKDQPSELEKTRKRIRFMGTDVDFFGLKERPVTELYASSPIAPTDFQAFRYPCSMCARTFHSPKALHGHMRSHPNRPSRVPRNSIPLQIRHRCLQSAMVADGDIEIEATKFFPRESREHCRQVLMEASRADISSHSNAQADQFDGRDTSSTTPPQTTFTSSIFSCSSVAEEPLQERERSAAVCLMMLAAEITDFGPCSAGQDFFQASVDEEVNRAVAYDDKKQIIQRHQLAPQFQCKTCFTIFDSPQALGGHRASHGNQKTSINRGRTVLSDDYSTVSDEILLGKGKGHECSVCHRIFLTGQALGGHKRHHIRTAGAHAPSLDSEPGRSTALSTSEKMQAHISTISQGNESVPTSMETGFVIDLNLPALMDDEEGQQSIFIPPEVCVANR